MAPSSSSSVGVSVPRCPVIFDGTIYRAWVPHMRLLMRGLRVWEFLTGDLPCPPRRTTPTPPVIPDRATTVGFYWLSVFIIEFIYSL